MAIGPFDIIGLIIILFITIFVSLNIRILRGKYKQNKNVSTLYMAMAFISFIGAIITLLLEKIGLAVIETLPSIEIFARTNAVLALISSGIAIIFINLFAFQNTFSNKKKILGAVIAFFTLIYVGTLAIANFNGFLSGGTFLSSIAGGEIVYDLIISMIAFPCLIPISISAPAVFFYFAFTIRSTNKPNSTRSLWMGIAVLLFFVGYTLEVTPLIAPYFILGSLSVMARVLMFSAAIIFYICFLMPQWFKNRIGWIEE